MKGRKRKVQHKYSERELVQYQEMLTHQDRLRVWIVKQPKRFPTFSLQLECLFRDRWRPVIRYDDAHGRPHIDILHADGTSEKIWLIDRGRHNHIREAKQALKENFAAYRSRYQKELEKWKKKK